MRHHTHRLSPSATGWRRIALIGIVVLCLTTDVQAQTTGARISKSVLFLSSDQIDLPVNTLAVQSMQDEFRQAADLNLNIYYEYLDINRFNDAAYQRALFDLYALKYRNTPVDLVIVGNSSMLELWLSKRADILPNAPVLFYDMNTAKAATLTLPPDVSGVTADVDFVKSARWFLRANPSVHEMILVHGLGQADQAFLPYVDAVRAELCGTVQCADWSSLPVTEMTRRAAALPNTAVIVYFLVMEDAAGVKYKPIDVVRQLAAASSVPVLTGYDQFIGTGTIGGYMYSIEGQARAVTRMGLRILRGEPVSAMPVQINTGTQFVFDHLALQRWNIPLSALPPERIVKNRRHSIWEHKLQLFGASAGIAILMLLTGYLGILTRRLRAAREILNQSNVNLEIQVRERTAALSQTNHRLEEENAERKRAERALRESEEKFAKAFHSNQVAMSLSTLDEGRYLDVNAEFLRLAERTYDEVVGHTTLELGIWAHPAQRDEIMTKIKEQGALHNSELDIRTKSGNILTLLWSAEQVTLRNTPCLLVSTFDISERKLVEKALRESEDRYRRVSSVISDIAYSCLSTETDEYAIDWMTGAAERITGYTVEEIKAERCWGALVIAEDRALFDQHITKLAPGSRSSCELRLRHKDGSVRWVASLAECVVSDSAPRASQLYGGLVDITERKQAEDALRRSEAFLDNILEHSPNSMWIADEQGTLMRMNQACRDLFHVRDEEVIGKYNILRDNLAEEQGFMPVVKQVFEQGAPARFVIQYDTSAIKGLELRQASTATLDVHISPILDAQGRVANAVIQHVDITERKRVEQILQESEAKYRRLVENLPGVVYVFSSVRGNVYCSTHVETILGYSPEYLYRHPRLWNQSIHPDDMPKVVAAVTQFQQGEHFKVEYRIKNAEGEWRWFYDLSIGRQDLPDETLIEGLALDITDRKRAEDELRLFKSIVESSEEAIAISDAAGRLIYINPAHVKLFGRSLEQARQANYREYYPPESLKILNRDVAPALTNGKSWQGVLDVFDATGRRFPLWEHADSIRDADGNMLYGFGFMHDDTLRKNVEDTLKHAKVIAEEANRIKSAFLATMSHELRTPLNSILGYTQMLKHDPTISAEQLKGLNIIEYSGNYLLDLINDILDLAKIEAGKLEVHPAPIHLPSLLDDARGMMAMKAEHKGLRLQLIQDPRMPNYVEGDAHRLRQILLNLLGNAIKFTDRGDVTLRVTTDSPRPLTEDAYSSGVSAAQPPDSPPGRGKGWVAADWQHLSVTNPPLPLPGGECVASQQNTSPCPDLPAGELARLRFDIEDSGVGIAADDLAKLFTPFQQVGDTARRAQGTGLGLAISRHLATLMGGTLTVTSAVGVGSVFRFEIALPVVAGSQSYLPKLAQEETPPPVAPDAAEMLLPSSAMLKTLFDLADIGDILGLRANLTALAQSEGGLTPFVEQLQELAQHFQLGQIRQVLLRSLEESNRRYADVLSDTERAAAIPAEWLARLRAAIAITDIQAIDSTLNDMRTIDPVLADTLAQLAYDFEYGKMARLLDSEQSQDAVEL